jgi:hypothetical protein
MYVISIFSLCAFPFRCAPLLSHSISLSPCPRLSLSLNASIPQTRLSLSLISSAPHRTLRLCPKSLRSLSLFPVNPAIKRPTSSSLSGDSSPNRDFLPYLSPRHGRPSLMPAPPLLWFVRWYGLPPFEPLLAFSPPLL